MFMTILRVEFEFLLKSERQSLRRKSCKILKFFGFSGVFSQTLQGTTDVYISLDREKFYSRRQQIFILKSVNYSNVRNVVCSNDSTLKERQTKHASKQKI
jgi:hypothetical protein